MNILLVIGRIALVLIFIVSGAQKLMDISGTATMISARVTIPSELSTVVAQLQSVTGMTIHQLIAMVMGVIELAAALMIAANIGTRIAALVLIIFTAMATYYFHDFWNMTGADRLNNLIQAQKNLSIVGALLILFVIGSWRPQESEYRESSVTTPPRY